MKKIYLVRHAKSSWSDPMLTDHERPLNRRGKSDAPAMGERLVSAGAKIDLLVTSDAKRARKTANKLAKRFNYEKEKIIKTSELYHGGQEGFLSILYQLSDDVNSIMIVGHDPEITDFANFFSGPYIYHVPTCAIVAVEADISSWKDLDSQSGKKIFFWNPKRNNEFGR